MPKPEPSNEWNINKKQIPYILGVAGVLLYIIFSIVWWNEIYKNPQRTFWGMLSNSLTTSSFRKEISESSDGESLNEYEQLQLGSQNTAEAVATLQEANEKVTQDTISTPNTDYTSYSSIQTDIKGTNGKDLNFNKLLGVWAKSSNTLSSSDALDHLFGQTLLGVIPIANLPYQERSSLISEMQAKHVFTPDLKDVKIQSIKDREVYVYSVSVSPKAYAMLMQHFATDLGLSNQSQLNPNNFQSTPFDLQLSVDVASRELVKVDYTGTNHSEEYSDYGIEANINIPTKTITSSQLQQKINQIEQ